MYSQSYLFLLATNVFSVWIALLPGEGHSYPIGLDRRCVGSGAGSVQCSKKLDPELVEQFRAENPGLQNLYLQKFHLGNETAYAGSFTNIYNNCVEDLVMDYDNQRFPQYLIQSTCKNSPKCKSTTDLLFVMKLNPSECDDQGKENYESQPPVFLSLCRETSS